MRRLDREDHSRYFLETVYFSRRMSSLSLSLSLSVCLFVSLSLSNIFSKTQHSLKYVARSV